MPMTGKAAILSRIAAMRNQVQRFDRELGELCLEVEAYDPTPPESSFDEDAFLAEPPGYHREPEPRANGRVMCKCGEPATLKTLTSKKTGNPYDVYVCAKPRGEQCDTFEFPKR